MGGPVVGPQDLGTTWMDGGVFLVNEVIFCERM